MSTEQLNVYLAGLATVAFVGYGYYMYRSDKRMKDDSQTREKMLAELKDKVDRVHPVGVSEN